MKKKIAKLLNSGKLNGKPVVIFGIVGTTYEALKILSNNQVDVQGIIASEEEVNKIKKFFGIKLYTFEQFNILFNQNVNLLIDRNVYKSFSGLMYHSKFRINNNLFVDFEILKGLEFIHYFALQILWGIVEFPSTFKKNVKKAVGQITILKRYLDEFRYIEKGRKVYNRIQKSYKEAMPILVYDYSGLGDVFVLSGLLSGNKHKIENGKFVLTVIGNASLKVAKLFNISNIISLTNEESLYLSHFAKILGDEYKVYSITPFSRVMYTEKISNSLAGCKINMLDMYKYLFFHLQESDNFSYPVLNEDELCVKKLFEQNNLEKGNTVILSPYANTVVGYSVDFWIELSEKLNEKGYCVCTNCGRNEKAIPGTKRFSFGLEIAQKVLDYAGFFIAIRNGFCDIVCNSDAKKIIIYPIYDLFNSDVYEFCSLKKMGIGKNFIELQWKYEKYEELGNIVLKYL